MNDKKVSDLNEARREKREKTGWTEEELRAIAKKEYAEYMKVMDKNPEPDAFASGDMNKIINGDDDDEEK